MIPSNSRVSTVTTSEWFNGIAHGTVTGELNTIFTQQLITGEFKRNANKHLKFVRQESTFGCSLFLSFTLFQMISYARLVEKDASIEDRLAKEIRRAEAVNDKQPQKAELDMNSHNLDFGYEPLGYREAIEKYAVVFCDFKKVNTFSSLLTKR